MLSLHLLNREEVVTCARRFVRRLALAHALCDWELLAAVSHVRENDLVYSSRCLLSPSPIAGIVSCAGVGVEAARVVGVTLLYCLCGVDGSRGTSGLLTCFNP
jgi:hypothetical protein